MTLTLTVTVILPPQPAQAGTQTNAIARTHDGQSHTGPVALATNAVTITPPNLPPVRIPIANIESLTFTGNTLAAPENEKGSGIGLLGYYYHGTDLLGPPLPRLDQTLHFTWQAHHPPHPDFDSDHFSVRWMGFLEPPRTDDYMIHFGSDDGGRFWINDQGPFSSWQRQEYTETNAILRMEQGNRYKIRVEFFEEVGNARARLWWSSPRMPKTIVPHHRLHPASFLLNHPASVQSNQGLLATYYDHPGFQGKSFTRTDPLINTNWNSPLPPLINTLRDRWDPLHREEQRAARALQRFLIKHPSQDNTDTLISELLSELRTTAIDARNAAERAGLELRDASVTLDNDIAPGIPANFFSVRWSGQLLAEQTQDHTFHVQSDEPTRFWFNNELVVDSATRPGESTFTHPLQANTRYSLRMETQNTDNSAEFKLLWNTPDSTPTVIPTRLLIASQPSSLLDDVDGAPTRFAPGVALDNGIYIQAPIRKVDATAIHFDGTLAHQPVPLVRTSRIHIRAITPAQMAQLQPGRTGLLLVNRDFVEGELVSLENGQVRISSVLFGLATFNTTTQVSVIVLRNGPPSPGSIQVRADDGTIVHAPSIESTPSGISFPGTSLQIPVELLTRIRTASDVK